MHVRKPSHRIFASVALAAMLAVLPVTSSVAEAQGVVNRGFSVPVSGTATAADGTVTTPGEPTPNSAASRSATARPGRRADQ